MEAVRPRDGLGGLESCCGACQIQQWHEEDDNTHKHTQKVNEWMFFQYQLTRVIRDKGPLKKAVVKMSHTCLYSQLHSFTEG